MQQNKSDGTKIAVYYGERGFASVPIRIFFTMLEDEGQYLVTVNCQYTGSTKDAEEMQEMSLMRFSFTDEQLSNLKFIDQGDGSYMTIKTAPKFTIPRLLSLAKNESTALNERLSGDLCRSISSAKMLSGPMIYKRAVEALESNPFRSLLKQKAFYEAFIKMANKPIDY